MYQIPGTLYLHCSELGGLHSLQLPLSSPSLLSPLSLLLSAAAAAASASGAGWAARALPAAPGSAAAAGRAGWRRETSAALQTEAAEQRVTRHQQIAQEVGHAVHPRVLPDRKNVFRNREKVGM